ncbi:MAG: hypothetical protein CVU48_08720 [Candidatus Cloacimonetes bacterium HGW-Cloacimonetes-1]|jgi:glycosyltransferase involved in cell wall biosynthesis|nr:MAG: hypothetical protein CVU48_08720 [Candidatus Cloacimonetes bacterium HGW-Cloacimonetes-1]
MKKIKILHIVTRLNIGGVAFHVIQLAKMFDNDQYESTILFGDVDAHEQDMRYLADQHNIRLINLPSMGRSINPLEDILCLWKAYRIIRTENPDIVLTHTAKAGVVGRIGAKLAGVKSIIHTFHGTNFTGYFGKLMSSVSMNIERVMAMLCTNVIVISDQQKAELLRFRICNAAKIRVIHLGFELEDMVYAPSDAGKFKTALGITPEKRIVAFVGRLTSIKNPFQIIKIAQHLLLIRDDVVFVFVGDGELTEGLKAEVRLAGLQDSVLFTGFLQDLKPLYADMDILLMTSLNEGTPVAIIEAMANRRIVVSSRVGGIPDLITHNESGYLFPPDQTDSFVAAISAILDDPQKYKQMTVLAHQKAVTEFSATRLQAKMSALFKEQF